MTLHRFWRMIAHYHGQTWNGAELARAFGVSGPTVRRYLDILAGSLVVRQLQPWWANLRKRQVRSPKVYIVDSGILHALLGLDTLEDLMGHPKVGASWEGFALGSVVTRLRARPQDCYFWATHAGAELDLLISRGNQRLGFEFKRTTAPRTTKSIHAAVESLDLQRLDIVHAGRETFPMRERIRAVSIHRLLEDLEPLP